MAASCLSLLHRVRVAAGLLSHRLSMERRFHRSALDTLLTELSGRTRPVSRLPLDLIERDVRRAERLLALSKQLSDTCLYRALARYAVLSKAGFPAVFLMGLPRGGGDEPGHAWVEVFGQPFAETRSVAELAVTFRYPPDGARSA
jgi:hypothetical protein